MRVVVLGNGFISRFIRESFYGKSNVFILTKKVNQYDKPGELSKYLKLNEMDTGINTCGFTGYPNVDSCQENKADCAYYNITVPLIIEQECKKAKVNFIHESSGCIYSGYEKAYTEEDKPNFGVDNPNASFYSKTKHASEDLLDKNFTNIVRIRMPLSSNIEHKNLITKLQKYDKIVDLVNSKTDVVKLSEFIFKVANNFKPGIYNAVHSHALTTKDVIKIMKSYDIVNDNWEYVDMKDLPIKANRSNCVLDNSKAEKDFDFDFGNEAYYIALICSLIQRIM